MKEPLTIKPHFLYLPPPFFNHQPQPMKKLLMTLALTAAVLTTTAVATPPPAQAQTASHNSWGDDDGPFVNSVRYWVSFQWLYYKNQGR